MSRFLCCLILFTQAIALNAQDDLMLKKHDPKRTEATVEVDFITTKKIHSNSKYKVLSSFDPQHHKTILWFHGFPVGKEINMSIRRVAQLNPKNFSLNHKFTLLEDGSFLNEHQQVRTHFCISSAGYLPGERIACYLSTTDGKFIKELSLIPNPIDIKNSAGVPIIEAELITLKPTVYQINVKGLNENEKLIFKSKSGPRITEIVETFTEDGISFTYSPELKGKKGGESIVEIRRQSGKKYTLKFPWGNRLTSFLDKDNAFNLR